MNLCTTFEMITEFTWSAHKGTGLFTQMMGVLEKHKNIYCYVCKVKFSSVGKTDAIVTNPVVRETLGDYLFEKMLYQCLGIHTTIQNYPHIMSTTGMCNSYDLQLLLVAIKQLFLD